MHYRNTLEVLFQGVGIPFGLETDSTSTATIDIASLRHKIPATANITTSISYTKGLSENFKNICGKLGFQVYFKGGNTIKNLLVAPKDTDNIVQKSGVIYRYKCDKLGCDEEYTGKSERTFMERLKETFPYI